MLYGYSLDSPVDPLGEPCLGGMDSLAVPDLRLELVAQVVPAVGSAVHLDVQPLSKTGPVFGEELACSGLAVLYDLKGQAGQR